MKIIIAAGGSGGHIFPAVALAEEIAARSKTSEILFVGSDKTLDKRIFEKEKFSYRLLSSNKLSFRVNFKTPFFFIKLFFDTVTAFFIVMNFKPDVVVGFGGYCSWPVVLAAAIRKIPTVVHEQNVVPGRANGFLLKYVDRIAISFDETRKYLGKFAYKHIFTGNPIRTGRLHDDRVMARKRYGFDAGHFTILVVGGSQGAHFLNMTFISAAEGIGVDTLSCLQIIHITGIKDYDEAVRRYADRRINARVYSYVDDIADAYSASDMVVTRAGASALFEVAYYGRPMVLIPYPYAMSHQVENARVFAYKGAAITCEERSLTADTLRTILGDLIRDANRRHEMARCAKEISVKDASQKLAEFILTYEKLHTC